MRVQLALNVENLEEAIDFYSKAFGVEVNKRKPGYANFAIDEPPLKLVLFENPGASERLNHLGVEVSLWRGRGCRYFASVARSWVSFLGFDNEARRKAVFFMRTAIAHPLVLYFL